MENLPKYIGIFILGLFLWTVSITLSTKIIENQLISKAESAAKKIADDYAPKYAEKLAAALQEEWREIWWNYLKAADELQK